jgi:streptogramin lyase
MIVGIDPVSNEVSGAFPVSTHPNALTVSGKRIWAGDFRDGSLWRIDPASGDLERFTTTGEPRDLSATANKVYVASDGETVFDGTVTRYDAATGARETGVRVLSCSIVAGEGVAWVAGCPYLVRLSTGPGPLRIIKSVLVPFQQPRKAETSRNAMHDMAIGEDALWVVGDPADRRVFKVDRESGAILTITTLAFAPRSVAAGEDGVWVTGSIDDVVARIDPVTARVMATIHVPAGASGVGAGLGGVWVASALDRSITRIDPRSLRVVKTIAVDGAPHEIAIGAGKVWATVDEG